MPRKSNPKLTRYLYRVREQLALFAAGLQAFGEQIATPQPDNEAWLFATGAHLTQARKASAEIRSLQPPGPARARHQQLMGHLNTLDQAALMIVAAFDQKLFDVCKPAAAQLVAGAKWLKEKI